MKNWFSLVVIVAVTIGMLHAVYPSEQEPGIVEMKVADVKLDPLAGQSIVILEDLKKKKAIPIWIGFSEANAIALEINGVVPPRPMTHDLIKSILEGLHTRVHHVLIHDVRENIIYARIILNLNGKEIPIDSRPSDAIALAIRVKAPIFVTSEVYEALSIDLKEGQGKESELSV